MLGHFNRRTTPNAFGTEKAAAQPDSIRLTDY